MKNRFIPIGFTFLIASSFGIAQEPPKSDTPEPGLMDKLLADEDSKFAMETAQSNNTEIELGKLASEKASNEELRNFGQKMAEDHAKANEELKAIAGKKGIQLPSDMGMKNEAIKRQLATLSGSDFDKAYMRLTMKGHKHDIEEFTKQSQTGRDPQWKDFATSNLPMLEEHFRLIRQIKLKINPKRYR